MNINQYHTLWGLPSIEDDMTTGTRWCSETEESKNDVFDGWNDPATCICKVGGDGYQGYPRLPTFDLVCTREHQDGCLGSSKTEVIPSTNHISGKRPPDTPIEIKEPEKKKSKSSSSTKI